MGPVSCGFMFFEAKNIKASAATHLEWHRWGFAWFYLDRGGGYYKSLLKCFVMKNSFSNFLKAFGPGLMFAAAAIGASHVVQSTRAGAAYGLTMIGIIILAGIIKYPAFRAGPHYAMATGESLLTAYRRQGAFVLWLFIFIVVSGIVAIQAAITITAAALLENLLHLPERPLLTSAALTLACIALIAVGRFRWLDIINKTLLLLLVLATLFVSILIWSEIPWETFTLWPDFSQFSLTDYLFMAALIGWMPSAIDLAVLNSMWTLARAQDTQYHPDLKQVFLDFNIGYIGTIVLAFFFVFLGAGVMYQAGITFSNNSTLFVEQFIGLYTQRLGDWTRPFVAFCAFAVMFSTLLVIMDGFPRLVRGLLVIPFVPLQNEKLLKLSETLPMGRKQYVIIAGGIGVLALAFLAWLSQSLIFMIDLATTLSFITAPFLAWFNFRALQSTRIPVSLRPKRAFMVYSGLCVILLAFLAAYYVWIRFL
jgi:Mn2+/Fe2+ NRAMP family transporter